MLKQQQVLVESKSGTYTPKVTDEELDHISRVIDTKMPS